MSTYDDSKLAWVNTAVVSTDEFKVFSVQRIESKHAHSERVGLFSVINSPNWVNILALTPNDEVVLIRQFRHGTHSVVTEIPGGMMDQGETPLEAAQRELQEETGYTSDNWVCLGASQPNPAIQSNQCIMYLALDATLTHCVSLDENEVIDTVLKPLTHMPELVYSGEIRHALILACFTYFTQLAHGWQRPSPEAISKWLPTYLGTHSIGF
jgi:ADP-ribose pyrophosphatase